MISRFDSVHQIRQSACQMFDRCHLEFYLLSPPLLDQSCAERSHMFTTAPPKSKMLNYDYTCTSPVWYCSCQRYPTRGWKSSTMTMKSMSLGSKIENASSVLYSACQKHDQSNRIQTFAQPHATRPTKK